MPHGPPPGDKKDFFISYTASDVAWARWIAWQLEKARFSVTLQDWDFRPGDNFVPRMHEALMEADRVLAVLTPAYMKSPSRFAKDEWTNALAASKLVPVRVADFEPDGLLRAVVYIDLVGKSEADAREALLSGLSKDGHPTVAPAFPGPAEHVSPPFPAALPPVWNVPYVRNQHFTGRKDTLERLREGFRSENELGRIQLVSGLGGVGKTQLAVELAYRFASEYDAILWVSGEDPTVLAAEYAALAHLLGLDAVPEQSRAIEQVRSDLSRRSRSLLIVDSAADEGTVERFLPPSTCRVLLTSRQQDFAIARCEHLEELSPEEAGDFLLERTKRTDRDTALLLAQRLGCLPLALEQAAAYIVACVSSLAAYMELLSEHGLDILEEGTARDHPATLAATLDVALGALENEPGAVALLQLCSFLAPHGIPLREIAGAAEHLPSDLRATLADTRQRNASKRALRRYSLCVVEADESLSVHRLVQELTRNRLDDAERQTWAGRAAKVMRALFPANAYAFDPATWDRCVRLLPHARAVVQHAGTQRIATAAVSDLANRLAGYLHGRGNLAEAKRLFHYALEVGEECYGTEAAEVAPLLNDLAVLLIDTARLHEAEHLLRRSLGINEFAYGPKHPEVATVLSNLAQRFLRAGRLAEAEHLMRRALAIDEAIHASPHPSLAKDLSNLGHLLHLAGRSDEAEPLLRQAVAQAEGALGPDHPYVATSLNNLALLLESTEPEKAESMYRRAVEIDKACYGPEHVRVAATLGNLGRLLAKGHPVDAESLHREALRIDEAAYGPDHPHVAGDLRDLANALGRSGQIAEAIETMRRAIEIHLAAHGSEHPDVARDHYVLARWLDRADRPQEAEPLMRRALEVTRAIHGGNHPDTRCIAAELERLEVALARPPAS